MRLPPALPPQEIVDTAVIEEPRIAARAGAPALHRAKRGPRVGFDTSDWRNWTVLAAGAAVIVGSAVRGFGQIGRPPLGIDGLPPLSAAGAVQMAAGAAVGGLLMLVLLPACLMTLLKRGSNGMLATLARTVIAAAALLLAGGNFAGDLATIRGPRSASAAAPQPALTPAQVMLNWEKAHPREVKEPSGTAEERHAAAVQRLSAHVEAISAPMAKQSEEFAKLGGLTPTTFTDGKSLEARIHLLMQAHANGEEALRQTRALPQTASKLADELGMDATESTRLIREMTGDGTVDRMVKVRELDCRLFDLLESYLSMIRSNRSKWEVENGKLTFTDAAFAGKVGTVGLEVKRVTQEQERLEGEIRKAATPTP